MEGLVALALVAVALLSMVVGLRRASQMLTEGMVFVVRGALVAAWHAVALALRAVFQLGGAITRSVFSAPRSTPLIVKPGRSPPLGLPERTPPVIADYGSLATPSELRALYDGDLPLGCYLHPTGSVARALALPLPLLLRHCAVFGPSGAGKTESILIPWCIAALGAGQSVVLIDVKGDLYDRLAPTARGLGAAVHYIAPHDLQRSEHWNFFDEIEDESDLDRIVRSILEQPRPNDPQPYFRERDSRILRALLRITHDYFGRDATPERLYQVLMDREQLREILFSDSELARHRSEVAELLSGSTEDFSRTTSGLQNRLHLFRSRALASLTENSTFRLSALWERPSMLILGARLADGAPAEVLSSCLLNLLFAAIYRRFDCSIRPLLLLIDEAPRLAGRIPYAEVLSLVRAAQVGVCLLGQDIVQFGDERAAHEVIANCATLILLRDCGYHTAQYFSNRLGDRLMPSFTYGQEQRDWPWQAAPPPTITGSLTRSPVLGLGEIMNLPLAREKRFPALVHAAGITRAPFLVDLTRES